EAEEKAYILNTAKKAVLETYPPDEIPVIAEKTPVGPSETHTAEKQNFVEKTKGDGEQADTLDINYHINGKER
ncbi:MAG: hypothetical protein RL736_936, partial [Pseudomonadota bacterium]